MIFYTIGAVAISLMAVLGLVIFPCIALVQYLLAARMLAKVCATLNGCLEDEKYALSQYAPPSVTQHPREISKSLPVPRMGNIFTHNYISQYSKAEISGLTVEQLEIFVLKAFHGLVDWPITHLRYLTEKQIQLFEAEPFPGKKYTYAQLVCKVCSLDLKTATGNSIVIDGVEFFSADGSPINDAMTLEQFVQCTKQRPKAPPSISSFENPLSISLSNSPNSPLDRRAT